MSDWPIIFSPRMIRALRERRKTQTRRLAWTGGAPSRWQQAKPGDRVMVREVHWRWGHWASAGRTRSGRPSLRFQAERPDVAFDEAPAEQPASPAENGWWKRPALFLPRAASRLTLTLTEVSRERLQALDEADAVAEGAVALDGGRFVDDDRDQHFGTYWFTARAWYQAVWEELHGPGAWDLNPEVVVLRFTVHSGNIDRLGREFDPS